MEMIKINKTDSITRVLALTRIFAVEHRNSSCGLKVTLYQEKTNLTKSMEVSQTSQKKKEKQMLEEFYEEKLKYKE